MYLSTATVLDTDFAFKTFKISKQESQAQSKTLIEHPLGSHSKVLKGLLEDFLKDNLMLLKLKYRKFVPFFI
jgi:hypothetical protein